MESLQIPLNAQGPLHENLLKFKPRPSLKWANYRREGYTTPSICKGSTHYKMLKAFKKQITNMIMMLCIMTSTLTTIVSTIRHKTTKTFLITQYMEPNVAHLQTQKNPSPKSRNLIYLPRKPTQKHK